jgi:hypothetical protein
MLNLQTYFDLSVLKVKVAKTDMHDHRLYHELFIYADGFGVLTKSSEINHRRTVVHTAMST